MTLAQKVGQVVQADIASVTPEEVQAYHLGSVLNGGNSAPDGRMQAAPEEWLKLADAFWNASMAPGGAGIPCMWGTDAVHGNNNVVGATIFPHNVGLGATGDEDLIERIGRATALEMRATGMDWTFAPTLAVTRDDRWGRAYESYSEDAEIVARLGAALVRGLQGTAGTRSFLDADHVIATAKHFLGDGGTLDGRDQGETSASEQQMRDIHAAGYVKAIEAGVQGMMASFSSWQGQRMHGRQDLLTDLLKTHWKFDGMVVGDWNGHGQLPGCSETDCPDAMRAGLDMYMAPDSWKPLIGNLTAQVEAGIIPAARLDDAVRRILRVKIRAGMLEAPCPSERPHGGEFALLGCTAHVRLADEAVRKSAVLLKNAGGVVPMRPDCKVLVVGPGADDLGMACGGWSQSWQGGGLQKADYPYAETLLEGVRRIVGQAGGVVEYSQDGAFSEKPDVAIVVFGEEPYAEFRGDLDTLDFCPGVERQAKQLRALREAGIAVVSVFYSGRPLWVNPELNASDAFVAAFLPGSRAGALAELLFADAGGQVVHDFCGRLSFSWPRDADQYVLNANDPDYAPLFPIGFGLAAGNVCELGVLHEESRAVAADRLTVFDQGRLIGQWVLNLSDSGGVERWDHGAHSSPEGIVRVHPVDHGRQENAIAVEWEGVGEVAFLHEPLDLERESNADFYLRIFFAAEAGTASRMQVSVLSPGQEVRFDRQPRKLDGELDEYCFDVSLKRAAAQGADVSQVQGVTLTLPVPGSIVLTRISFETITR
ncbi:MAG: glycoside hydrolase family 3 N-terminal domain-containing protein [Hyphomonas sp.]|uniref:glycoside hydrolase family 3 protein n=1 Tax=Hyphomonas sp. TaxID=87 RepID=UPI0035278988